jgi:hypothetical protein
MKVIGQLQRLFSDKFLRLLYPQLRQGFAIESHLTFPERVALYRLARDAVWVAEIGSYLGASACCLGAALADRGRGKLICVDTWENDAMSEGPRNTWAAFLANTERYRSLLIPVRGSSTEAAERVRECTSRLDLLFIDGDHSYDGVRADWDAYKVFLTPGSVVAFHDYGWAPGVQRVVNETVLPCVGWHHHLPNLWWGTMAGKA